MKARTSVREALLSEEYVKGSAEHLSDFQKKLHSDSLFYTNKALLFRKKRKTITSTSKKELPQRTLSKKRLTHSRLFRSNNLRTLTLRKFRNACKHVSGALKQSALFPRAKDFYRKQLSRVCTLPNYPGNVVARKKLRKLAPLTFNFRPRTSVHAPAHNYEANLGLPVSFDNSFYRRSLLRRRVRGARLLRYRAKLKRSSPLVLPTLFEIGQTRPRYPKRIY